MSLSGTQAPCGLVHRTEIHIVCLLMPRCLLSYDCTKPRDRRWTLNLPEVGAVFLVSRLGQCNLNLATSFLLPPFKKTSMDSPRRPLADTSNSSAQSPSPRQSVGSKSAASKSTRRRRSKSRRSTKANKATTTKENVEEVHSSPSFVCDSAYCHFK